MKIGLFGGTFDPPHLGHQQVASALLEQGYLDELWFVPVFEHPWAARLGKQFSAYDHRVAMLERIVGENQKVVHFKQVSYTYDTLIHFSKQNPDDQIFWVMGSEYLPKFDDFLKGHPLLLDFPFLIYPREGFPMEPVYPHMTALEDVPTVKISSTEVREKHRSGEDISGLVDERVLDYIEAQELYLG